MSEDPLFGAYETRLLVFLETDTYDGFHQVYLNKEQFKKVSDAIIRSISKDETNLKENMEIVKIQMSEDIIPPTLFEGMNSISIV
jgi:hypothetical protein